MTEFSPKIATKIATKIAAIKAWATDNYDKSYGASCLIECFTDEELAIEFTSLTDAKRYARLMNDEYSNTRE